MTEIEEIEQSKENYLTYGSIVSWLLDYNNTWESTTKLTFDPNNHNKKNQLLSQSSLISVDRQSSSAPSQKKGWKSKLKSKTINNTNQVDSLFQKQFLFTQGVFNDNCYFYKFQNQIDIEINFMNSLLLILPASENDSLPKLENVIQSLKVAWSNHQNDKIIYKQVNEAFNKFKQEIKTNHEQAMETLKHNAFVNFGDTVQFLHLSSGKFWQFNKNKEDLKIYISLTSTMGKNTIFRIYHGYGYQSENSTTVFFNLGIKIACGDKTTNREKFLSNSLLNLDGTPIKQNSFATKKNASLSRVVMPRLTKSQTRVDNIVRTKSFIDLSHTLKRNKSGNQTKQCGYGKQLPVEKDQVICDDKCFNQWKWLKFTNNYWSEDIYINSLDYVWIENCEKDVYLASSYLSKKDWTDLKKRENQEIQNLNLKDKNGNQWNSGQGNLTNQNSNENNIWIQKMPDKEEKFPSINNGVVIPQHAKCQSQLIIPSTVQGFYNWGVNNINSDEPDPIPWNYFYDEKKNYNQLYQIGLQPKYDNDLKDPFGVFRFEIITGRDSYNNASFPWFGPWSRRTAFRIRNMFTNKLLCVENNELISQSAIPQSLKMINDSDVGNDNIKLDDIWFTMETAYEQKRKDKKEDDLYSKEKDKADTAGKKKNFYIKKTDTVRIRAKKYNSYWAVRQIPNENKALLLLTKNLSDWTIFKMAFLYEKDKSELHFFEHFNFEYDYIIDYWKKENKTDEFENSEKIKHILLVAKSWISKYKVIKSNVNNEENRCFDILRNMSQFNFISKLMDIFLMLWFRNKYNETSDKLDACLKTEVSNLYKIEITKTILKIFKLLFDLDSSFINAIQDKLHYFFNFVGYIDKCTKFLIHILHNNNTLLLKLLFKDEVTKSNQNFDDIQFSLKRILHTYNSLEESQLLMSFKSFTILFDFLNSMWICNDEPFKPFYESFFKNLNLITFQGGVKKPNIDENKIWIDFMFKDNYIKVRKKRFDGDSVNNAQKSNNPQMDTGFKKINNLGYIDVDISLKDRATETWVNNSTIIPRISTMNIRSSTFGIGNNMITSQDDLLPKIICLNLLLYSNISLHDKDFKKYLLRIFKMDRVEFYLNTPNLPNDIKCAMIRLVNYLYLKKSSPLVDNMGLCRQISTKPTLNPNAIVKKNSFVLAPKAPAIGKKKENPVDTLNIHIKAMLLAQAKSTQAISNTSWLLYILESCQYILRHVYELGDEPENKGRAQDFITII